VSVNVSLKNVGSVSRYLWLCAQIRSWWIAREQRRGEEDEIWFRGQPDERFGLVPKLYRPKFVGSNEADIRQEFQSRAMQLVRSERMPGTKYEWYFLMQHYGAPTRLLDWTASAPIALYFAVRPALDADGSARGPDPAVWVLYPWWLNRRLRFGKRKTRVDGPLLPDWQEAGRYLRDLEKAFETESDTTQKLPAAIEPPHVDARLAAQASRFVIFGQSHDLSKLKAVGDKDCQILKIVVARKARRQILDDLNDMGIRESTVFPDLTGLCVDICRKWEKSR
jgi:hypothetical protein